MSPKVVLQPIDETIDCAADESVLDAAFRQGYNLAYGCREGQCSACKCFLVEGEVAMKRYSTFALSESESNSGYTLMCRAMPEQDLVIELLHFDPDAYKLEHAIRDGRAEVVEVEALTHDITRLHLKVLEPEDFSFKPGQYVDLHVPGEEGVTRSFSLANVPGDGHIELIIKRYPGGKLSGMLGERIKPGDEIGFTGPYGAFHLRRSQRPILMVAGGSGMAPILALLRQLSTEGTERPVRFFYGARTESDLFYGDLIGELGSGIEDFRYTTVLSDGEGGRFVHDAVDEFLAAGGIDLDLEAYMCGPPPMIDAAQAMLTGKHKVSEKRIFHDKFTTSADAGGEQGPAAAPAEGAAPPVKRMGDGAVQPSGDESERQFSWYTPRKRRATLYEDVTIDTQPSIHRHLKRDWPAHFEDGRGTWDDGSTVLRSSDWYDFRDPGQQWERPYYQKGTAVENQIEGAIRSAAEEGVFEDFRPEWVEFLRSYLQVPAFVENGLWFATATAARGCLSDSITACVALQAAMKQRSAQALVLYGMDLENHHGEFPIEEARRRFLTEEAWQPTRRYLERLAATADWGELIVAANLCFEPVVGNLLRRDIGIRAAAANGDTVTSVLARVAGQEWEWVRDWTVEFMRFVVEDPEHGAANRDRIAGWVRDWLPQASEAALALAPIAATLPVGIDMEQAWERVQADAGAMLDEAGLQELCELVGHTPAEPAPKAPPVRANGAKPEAEKPVVKKPAAPPSPAPVSSSDEGAPPAEPDGKTYDFVGIVMAKSAEGDAVAAIIRNQPGVQIHEQQSFWDIRAKDRLVINYDEVSEELGYEIDAYSIQHEMSTHYGRMVAGDDALMLFSDPMEAMEHLMS